MPNYGVNKYGRFQYGKYTLSSGGSAGDHTLGPHIRYRIRTISHNGDRSDFLTMCESRVSIKSKEAVSTRIRANNGEWVYAQNAVIKKDAVKVRIRSVSKAGKESEWIYGDRGNLR